MKKVLIIVFFITAYSYIGYHFVFKVFTPVFFPEPYYIVNDFGTYYVASKILSEGNNPYRSNDNYRSTVITEREMSDWQIQRNRNGAYIYPSFLAFMITPLAQLPYLQARFIWNIFCLLGFFASVFLTFYLLGKKPKLDISTLLVMFVFFCSMPTLENFTLGQINYIVLALILLCSYLAKERLSFFGGGVLAIAVLIKVSPVFLLLYFLWRKDYRLLFGFIVFFGALFIGLQLLTHSADIFYLREVLPAISGRIPDHANKSVSVWWQYLFMNNELCSPIINLPILATILSVVSAIAVISISCFTLNRSQFNKYSFVPFAFGIVIMLLIQPYVEIHHLVMAFVPFSCLIIFYTSQAFDWRKIILLAVTFIFLNNRGENSFDRVGHFWFSAFLSNPQAYGLILLFVLPLLAIRQRQKGHSINLKNT